MSDVRVKAVTFDFWNTVMWEEPGSLRAWRLECWQQALSKLGSWSARPEALEAAHDQAHMAYERAWRVGRQFRVADAVALIVETIGRQLPDTAADTLAEGFSEAGLRAAVHPCDGIQSCLGELRSNGVRLGIVCDIGLTPSSVVRNLLERHDLLRFFEYTAFSDEIGHYKPSRVIFERALEGLGAFAPTASAHVGDRLRTDVAGARRMGMTSVRYRGVFDDPESGPQADIVIDHLAELPALLGAHEVAR
jgi:FMN phosphatase YigB (HAD superfamily)